MMKALKLTALLLAAALLSCVFAGCGKTGSLIASSGTDTQGTTAATDTEAATDTDAVKPSDFDYSDGIGDDGYLTGIKALDLVTLPAYKGIEMPAASREVTEAELEEQLSSLLASFPQTNKITDRAVENGDTVNIDYVGSIDGVEFEGGNTKGQGTDVTAGATNYIDDFLTQIIGHMPGETFDVNVTFPDPYENNPDLSGKDAVFVTTINYIAEKVDPELTDDFVKENLTANYSWETADEVREYFRGVVLRRKLHTFVDDYLTANSQISELPASLVEYQTNAMLCYYESYASQYGVSLEDFIVAGGYDSTDALVEDQRDALEKAAKVMLLIQAVAESEGITLTESDVDAFIKSAYLSATDETLPQIKEYYGLGYWAQETLADAVYELIGENAVAK